MKLWKKILLGTLIIFSIGFDLGAFFLISQAYHNNLEHEINLGIREQNIILSTLSSTLMRAEEFDSKILDNKTRLSSIIESLANYYKKQNVSLALYCNKKNIYSNISTLDRQCLKFTNKKSKNIVDNKINGVHILFVSARLPDFPDLILVYARNINSVDEFYSSITNSYVLICIVIMALMTISIFFFLKRITAPIVKLNNVTTEVSNGLNVKRITIKSNDEIGQLARNFNKMIDSIEKTMEDLRIQAKDKQQFIDDLSHEMKTPITSILGYSEFLKNTNCSKDDQFVAINHLQNSIVRLQNLSSELLKLTMLKNEKIVIKRILTNDLLKELFCTMQPILVSLDVTLLTEQRLEYLFGDKTLLISLLTNLVENAARASSSGNKIIVKVYKTDSPIIEVIDEGIGISEKEIKKITEPFYRADKSRSRKFGGVGLGLSISLRIVELHNANMVIKSKEHQGTIVQVRFNNNK